MTEKELKDAQSLQKDAQYARQAVENLEENLKEWASDEEKSKYIEIYLHRPILAKAQMKEITQHLEDMIAIYKKIADEKQEEFNGFVGTSQRENPVDQYGNLLLENFELQR